MGKQGAGDADSGPVSARQMTDHRTVRRVLGPMGHGRSRPLLVESFDGSRFVLKYKNNRQGLRVLVNEYVATQLAPVLGAPCPPSEILDLPHELIAVADLRVPNSTELVAGGLSFGSVYMDQAFDSPPVPLMEGVENRHQAAGAIVLDTWTLNGDRTRNPGNIIAYPVPGATSTYRFAVIDQGHCFTGPGWTQGSLERAVDCTALQGNNPILKPGVAGRVSFEPFLVRLESMEESHIRSVIERVPEEWGMSAQEGAALAEFLEVRRKKIRGIIDAHFQ